MPHQGQNFFHLHLSILWICVLTRVHTHAHTRTHTRTHTSARAHTHTTHTVAIENMQTCRRWWGAPLSLPPSSTRQTFDMSRIRYQGTDLSELKKKSEFISEWYQGTDSSGKKNTVPGLHTALRIPSSTATFLGVCVCVCLCGVCVCVYCASPHLPRLSSVCLCVCVCEKKTQLTYTIHASIKK
jgi:hypothetical protein